MPNRRLVTGVFRTPDGTIFANKSLTWLRNPRATVAQGGAVIVDEPFVVQTNSSGEMSREIEPGSYIVMVRLSDVDRYFQVGIPEGTSAFQVSDGIVAGQPVITADLVLQAQLARDAAKAEADSARVDADRAEAAAGTIPLNRPSFSGLATITPEQLPVGGLVVTTDNGAVYERVSAGGDLDFTGTGGLRLRAIPQNGEYTSAQIGVLPTDTDAQLKINAHLARMSARYSGGPNGVREKLVLVGDITINSAIETRDNTILENRGIVRQTLTTTSPFPANACVAIGHWNPGDAAAFVQRPTVGITAGAFNVTLSDPAHAADFAVNDLVMVSVPSGEVLLASPNTQSSQFQQIARVVAVSGAVITFDTPVKRSAAAASGTYAAGSAPTGAWIANVSWRANAANVVGLRRRHFADRVDVFGGLWVGSGGHWTARTGMYESRIEWIRHKGCLTGFFGNAFCNSRIANISGEFFDRAFEAKDGCHGSSFENMQFARLPALSGGVADALFSIGQIFDCEISGIEINAGNHAVASGMFAITTHVDNVDISNITLRGSGTCPSLISFDNSASNVRIRNSLLDLPVTGGAVLFGGTNNVVQGVIFPQGGSVNLRQGVRCALEACEFGVLSTVSATAGTTTGQSGNRVLNNSGVQFVRDPASETGLLRNIIGGNQNYRSRVVRELSLNTYDQVAVTTATINEPLRTVSFPADTLQRFDVIRLFASGTFASAGEKSLRYLFAGVEIFSHTDTSGTAKAWELRAETVIGTVTRFTTTFTLTAGGLIVAQGNVRHTSLDLTAVNASQLQAWVGAGTINLRHFRHDLLRQGMAISPWQV